jgi:hypothetical protein
VSGCQRHLDRLSHAKVTPEPGARSTRRQAIPLGVPAAGVVSRRCLCRIDCQFITSTWPRLHRPKSKICNASDRRRLRTTYPSSHSQNSMLDTPDALPEVARVVLTALEACTPSGGCDDESPQAHSRVWV